MIINNFPTSPVNTLRLGCGRRSSPAPFSRMLSDTQQKNKTSAIFVHLPTKDTVYSGGIGHQTVYAEYTSASTDEDPVVRIKGQANNGEYDFVCHINDIDPSKASYAEMCALFGHLQKTGQSNPDPRIIHFNVLPHGISTGNVTQRLNYMSEIERMTTSQMFTQPNRTEAESLLKLYQDFINMEKENLS